MDESAIARYFAATPAIAALCSQNGWPDHDSLKIEVLERGRDSALCAVSFEEILVEGAGCVAGRVPCWGRFRVQWDAAGRIVHASRID
ncbi:hypothetical protein [Acidiferrobacter sp.]|uniref:hypothetical protein n=1 Tax=Acidiferrobacter sp. TaxID=1872107 RepID=UPI0026111554|nr:hypothetical protein [Acidiferrobacter sp.]